MQLKIFLVVVLFSSIAYSQKNASSLEFSAGITQDGYATSLSYDYYTSDKDYIQGSLFLGFSEDEVAGENIPYNIFSLNIGYYHTVFDFFQNRLNIALGGGGIIGYELINNGDDTLNNGALIDAESQFLYGLFVGSELDYTISRNWSLTLKVNEYYHIPSDLGQFLFYGGLGVKYYMF